jgi:hypothetical protein
MIAPRIQPRAKKISLLPKEKCKAFRKITVSTHSLTTLAKAKIDNIQS